ncbi:MAG: FliH/SctL family protein [Bacillota bacterium]|nr:FliH/SctL family protein [Bacillota bacterium]
MLSSFNVIKNNNVIHGGDKSIVTKFDNPVTKEVNENFTKEIITKEHVENYENFTKNILENAKMQSQSILTNAYTEAEKIENEANSKVNEIVSKAYEKGYNEGHQKGYDVALVNASLEAEKAKKKTDDMIALVDQECKSYIENKKEDIIKLIINITEEILQREVKNEDSISQMVFNAIEKAKNAKRYVVRCNSLYSNNIKEQIKLWKDQMATNADIFVISDDSVQFGNAVVEKDNGKITVGIDEGMEKLRTIFEENEF